MFVKLKLLDLTTSWGRFPPEFTIIPYFTPRRDARIQRRDANDRKVVVEIISDGKLLYSLYVIETHSS